jgi:CRP/FNR family nitrogen fixation transcriptional regulator
MPSRSSPVIQREQRHTQEASSCVPALEKLNSIAAAFTCRRGQVICHQDRPASAWYRVESGAARRYVVRIDGRRQIVDLLLPGDFFGFTPHRQFDFTVDAIAENTVIVSYPCRTVEKLADADPDLAHELRRVAFEAMSRLQSQVLIIGRVTAMEKVGSFLLEIASRLSRGRGDRIVLPMSRYDIADYLALSVETVSRALTDLKRRGMIVSASTRQFRIVDPDALEDGNFWTNRAKHL